ncbi:hypothetical protein C9374_007966 [Naegleria lovaniensis]|uniref:persulfide dioxygenase n=1 Tax=Naegleria lovaniensis TaxID=51637 RepID=A0AA88GM91_NAELO|nr:uncharacterized protein C9374_007966 [Naegleria lovaniensis]KAG2378818.1 hypothetical protein C9374_007966 [Naegleria lovaniensis]
MIFRQLISADTSTYTFILGCEKTGKAAIIDPVLEECERDSKLIKELGLTVTHILDTHVHADHITGGMELKKKFPEATHCYSIHSGVTFTEGLTLIKEGDVIQIGDSIKIHVLETPGHTNGCITYYLDDKSMVFTGDALFIRGCGRTDFQQGSASTLYDSIMKIYSILPDSCLVYPGHDYKGMLCSTVGEEKKYNPRIFATQTREGFVEIMDNLKLAKPRYLDVALPANLVGGVKQ